MRRHALLAGVVVLATLPGCKGASAPALEEMGTMVAASAAASVIQAAAQSGGSGPSSEGSEDPPPPSARPIDIEHARATLLLTNLSACWPSGASHGPGYVEVTFRWNGTVSHVAVTRTPTGPQLDQDCVASRLKDVIVDPFAGDTVALRVTYEGR